MGQHVTSKAKLSLMEKAILGYRKSGAGGTQVRASGAKMGAPKTEKAPPKAKG